MRVHAKDERQVARHMGSCQPGRATINQHAQAMNAKEELDSGRTSSAPEQFMAIGINLGKLNWFKVTFNAQTGTRIMAIHKSDHNVAFPHFSTRPEQILKATEHTLSRCRLSPRISVKRGRCRMPERQRMSSRRIGSRGRPATQRPATSPSSSVDIPPEPGSSSSPRRTVGHRIERDRGALMECGHREHPAVKYRIPCTLENNTLIVSVTVEHCSDLRRPQDNLTVPRVDMQVPRVDLRRPTQADEVEAGPSEPAQKGMRLDVEEDKKLKGLAMEDEPYLTDED